MADKKIINSAANIRKPRVVAFEVTRRCKLNCLHCRASAQADFQNDLTTEQCKKIIKLVADYNRCVLIFTGGEPFEREDIFDLIDYAASCGLAVSLATCGHDFDEKKAQMLKNKGLITISFSLDFDNARRHDDFRQTVGAFDKTISAINIARKFGLKFQINTTVTRFNFDRLRRIAELSQKLGAYCFNPFMLVPAGRAQVLSDYSLTCGEYEKALRIVADLKNESKIDVRFTCAPRFAPVFKDSYPQSKVKVFGCLAAGDFAFISHSGDVQTCGFLKISAGNVLQAGDFGSIWEKSELLNSIRRKKFTGKCGDCNYAQICGGCRARAFAQTGDYLASDPLCSYTRITSTLIAAHIEENMISVAANAINSLLNVSHHYLRNHYYNLWFTLKGNRVEETIKELSEKFKTPFMSFPVIKRYKLDSSAIKRHSPPDIFNALFCCVADGKAAEFLTDLPQVSHCYERQTHSHWPYNLYAMFHAQSPKQLESIVEDFVKKFNIEKFQILPTVRSLKQ